MRFYIILLLCLCLVPNLYSQTFNDVSKFAGVVQRETPIDENSGTWMGPGSRLCRL